MSHNTEIKTATSMQKVVDIVDQIVKSKKGQFLSKDQYYSITNVINLNLNGEDLFFAEDGLPTELTELLDGCEFYYGFNENEVLSLLTDVNKLGYTFSYVDVATQENGEFSHTVKPYYLRKITEPTSQVNADGELEMLRPYIETMDDVITAVREGKTVCWSNDSYQVIEVSKSSYLIKFIPNGHCVGLMNEDNVTSSYKPEDFYVKEEVN